MPEYIIYIFKNVLQNYCKGDFYFVAENKERAIEMANEFAAAHNKGVEGNSNYIIEWDQVDIQPFMIVEGYLPINRGTIDS